MEKKKDKKPEIHICYICGKEIDPGTPTEYVQTRRRSKLWMHRGCARGQMGGRS